MYCYNTVLSSCINLTCIWPSVRQCHPRLYIHCMSNWQLHGIAQMLGNCNNIWMPAYQLCVIEMSEQQLCLNISLSYQFLAQCCNPVAAQARQKGCMCVMAWLTRWHRQSASLHYASAARDCYGCDSWMSNSTSVKPLVSDCHAHHV